MTFLAVNSYEVGYNNVCTVGQVEIIQGYLGPKTQQLSPVIVRKKLRKVIDPSSLFLSPCLSSGESKKEQKLINESEGSKGRLLLGTLIVMNDNYFLEYNSQRYKGFYPSAIPAPTPVYICLPSQAFFWLWPLFLFSFSFQRPPPPYITRDSICTYST